MILFFIISSLADTGMDTGYPDSGCVADPRFDNFEIENGVCVDDTGQYLCQEWPNDICPTWDEMISDYYQFHKVYFFYECASDDIAQNMIFHYITSEEYKFYIFDQNGKMISRSYSFGIGTPFCCDGHEVFSYTIGSFYCNETLIDSPPDPTPDSPASPATEDSTSKPESAPCGCTSTAPSSALALLPLLLLVRKRKGQP